MSRAVYFSNAEKCRKKTRWMNCLKEAKKKSVKTARSSVSIRLGGAGYPYHQRGYMSGTEAAELLLRREAPALRRITGAHHGRLNGFSTTARAGRPRAPHQQTRAAVSLRLPVSLRRMYAPILSHRAAIPGVAFA